MRDLLMRFGSLTAAGVVVLTLAFPGVARGQDVDITGTWVFSVQTDGGGGTPTVTFQQNGEELTGHYSSETLGEADFTGTVKDSEIAFSFEVDAQGVPAEVNYSGTIESAEKITGTLDLAGMLSGTFTAVPKPES